METRWHWSYNDMWESDFPNTLRVKPRHQDFLNTLNIKRNPSNNNYPEYRIIWTQNFWFVHHFAATKMCIKMYILAKSSVSQFCSWEYSTNFMKPEVVPSRYRKAPCATSLLCPVVNDTRVFIWFLAFPFWMTTQSPTSYHFTKKVPRVYCHPFCEIPKGSGF